MDVSLVVLPLALLYYFYFLQLPFVVALVYWYLAEVAWSAVKVLQTSGLRWKTLVWDLQLKDQHTRLDSFVSIPLLLTILLVGPEKKRNIGNNKIIVHAQDMFNVRADPKRCGAQIVFRKTYSLLLRVLEQSRVDNSNVGLNWEQLVHWLKASHV